MTTACDLASISRLMGDPARASMICALMGGSALAAGELARIAGVTPATASGHLKQLVEGGLLGVVPQGKHRYFRITDPAVATAVEALGAIAGGARVKGHPAWRHGDDLRFARTCYDHLAGVSAVALHDGLLGRGLLEPDGNGYQVTATGRTELGRFGIDLDRLRKRQRGFACPCLDWSERKPHLGGALAAAMLEQCVDHGWIRRGDRPRIVQVTPKGRRELSDRFGVRL